MKKWSMTSITDSQPYIHYSYIHFPPSFIHTFSVSSDKIPGPTQLFFQGILWGLYVIFILGGPLWIVAVLFYCCIRRVNDWSDHQLAGAIGKDSRDDDNKPTFYNSYRHWKEVQQGRTVYLLIFIEILFFLIRYWTSLPYSHLNFSFFRASLFSPLYHYVVCFPFLPYSLADPSYITNPLSLAPSMWEWYYGFNQTS